MTEKWLTWLADDTWMVFAASEVVTIDEARDLGMRYPAHIADDIDTEEHAILIAAAPDLLAACEAEGGPDTLEYAATIIETLDPGGSLPGQLRRKAEAARTAIIRARGE